MKEFEIKTKSTQANRLKKTILLFFVQGAFLFAGNSSLASTNNPVRAVFNYELCGVEFSCVDEFVQESLGIVRFFKSLGGLFGDFSRVILPPSPELRRARGPDVFGGYGYVDSTGKFVIEPQFVMAGEFSEGLAAVAVDGQWGFIDTKGNFFIEPQFHFARAFQEGLAAVYDKSLKKWGYINRSGDPVIPPKFYNAFGFENGVAEVSIKGEEESRKIKIVVTPLTDPESSADSITLSPTHD